jgi:serine phosphatase RsbU (regulator of sigma subunit)
LLGGDFFDAVQTADQTVWAVIGDVCGHGPDEAALGVCLRIAWRTLILAGHPDSQILPTLQQVLIHERHQPSVFTTLCMVAVDPARLRARIWLAGHPPPLLLAPGHQGTFAVGVTPQVPLGVLTDFRWSATEIDLGTEWRLLLYTDGLIEGRPVDRSPRLDVAGLLGLLGSLDQPIRGEPSTIVDRLLRRVQELTPGHDDDVAVMMLAHVDEAEAGSHPGGAGDG